MTDGVLVRLAVEGDLGAIGGIYDYYIENSTCTFQTVAQTAEEYAAWFGERAVEHPVTVAEVGGQVVGWAALSPWSSRCAYEHSVEGSVYVDKDCHRRGIGRALLEDLIERARQLGHRTLIGGACTEHVASLALQERMGFGRVGVFREVGFKFGRWLDVEYMQLML